MPGTLYVVSTPIGNLEDITYRAVRILGEVSLVACEDTRQTQKLLHRYGISTKAVSYHDHNEAERTPDLLRRLEAGESVALVSDAGTPLVSDPGYRLLSQAAALGLPISPIPGPSALLSAIAASGLPTDRFLFGGFLPAKEQQRRKALEGYRDREYTLVIYESPHRLEECLTEIAAILNDPPVVVGREMTKLHEEFLRGPASRLAREVASRPSVKGECTLVIGRSQTIAEPAEPLADRLQTLLDSGAERMEAIKQIARERGLSKREVYAQIEELK